MYKYVNGKDKRYVKFYVSHYPDASLCVSYSVLCDDGTYTHPIELSTWGAMVGAKGLHAVNHIYVDRYSFDPLMEALKKDGFIYGPGKKIVDDIGMFDPVWDYEFDEHFLSDEDHDNYLAYLKNLTKAYGLLP